MATSDDDMRPVVRYAGERYATLVLLERERASADALDEARAAWRLARDLLWPSEQVAAIEHGVEVAACALDAARADAGGAAWS